MRYNSNGSLDTTFGTGGIAEAGIGVAFTHGVGAALERFLPGRERREFSGVQLHGSAAIHGDAGAIGRGHPVGVGLLFPGPFPAER